MKKDLPTVTLLGIDCVDIERLAVAAKICQEEFNFGAVKLLTSLSTNNLKDVVKIRPITSVEDYSEFAITQLNNYVDTSHVLIIQYDGFILNPKAWTDEYLEYDYIGSPLYINDWAVNSFNLNPLTKGSWVVGNGGFSLRSKKLLQAIETMGRENKISVYHPEDVTICIKLREELEERGIKFAPLKLAEKFSFEYGTLNNKIAWTDEFGFHGLKWSDISAWVKLHPEHKIINNFDRKNYEE